MPEVSVQLPCYNSEKYIYETIKSVLEQTFADFELVVINDGSTDRTEDIVKSFSDKRIKYLYQNNQGLATTRNRAVSLSNGEFIAFIDHDDIWYSDKLEKEVSLLDKNPKVGLVYSNFFKLYPDGKKVLALRRNQPQGKVFVRFLYSYPIGLLTAMIRKGMLDELGALFDENLGIFEDYDLFMRILYRYEAAYLEEPLAIYRIHDKRASNIMRDRYPDEYAYVVEKFKKNIPAFEKEYTHALNQLKANMAHLRAKIAMNKLDSLAAREYLCPYKLFGHKFFILYLLTFLPPFIWNKLHDYKNKGVVF